MQFDISGNPAYGDLTVVLEAGEQLWTEGGAMSRMSAGLDLRTRLIGGLLRSVARKFLGGESFLLAEYTAEETGFVSLSPSVPGSVHHRELTGSTDTLLLTAGSFLACTAGMNMRAKFGGLRSFFSGEGSFLLEMSGEGDLFFNTYGGLVEKQISGEYVVDTGHVVAFEPTLDYRITGMGGWKQTLFSGEGLVMRFSGQGTIWLQTRQMGGVAGWLSRYVRG